MDRWYYAKKWFAIFPGFREAVCAPFLADYYRERRDARGWPRLLLDGAVCVAFKAWVPFRAREVARRFGFDRAWARRASAIGRRRFVDPNDLAVFRIEQAADADRYLRRFEYAAISKRINPAAWRPDCALADKARFGARCAAHDLPSPPLVARIVDGQVTLLASPPASGRLAVKPTGGLGGVGFAPIDLPPGTPVAVALAALRHRAAFRRGDWVVQPWIAGHDAVRDLALNALSTARLTTFRNERGEPEIVTAVLRFAGSLEAVVDNLAAGGLLAPIDLAAGALGPACYGRRPGDVIAHPVTGAPIEGRVLPFWPEMRALVCHAHRIAFAEYSMIGWDVGLGADGPVLIEGNGKPGLFAAQRAARNGIGDTRFGALLAHHLALTARNQPAVLVGDVIGRQEARSRAT